MGKVLFKCPDCSGTEDFVFFNGQLSCLCGVDKAGDSPFLITNPPDAYDLIVHENDNTSGLGKPFKG